jgi:cytochrome c5
LISTPKQLVIVVLLAFAVPLTVILLVVQFITSGINADSNSAAMSEAAIAERMQVLNSNASTQSANAPTSDSVIAVVDPGESLYNTVCQACHAAGIAGAPKTGDQSVWGDRLELGNDVLYQSVIKGKNLMPARGGATSASNDDIKAAVDFMLSTLQ